MNEHQPTVDILLATHNGEKYLREQIESIRYQTYENWRMLVSDDCSSDNTLGIIKGYAKADSRIALVSESKRFGGAKENFFHLLQQSTSQLAMFCDQDDVWMDDKIEVTLRSMLQAEASTDSSLPIAIFTDSVVVDEHLQVLSYSFHNYLNISPYRTKHNHLLLENTASGNTMMLNRPLIRLLQEVKQPTKTCMHDWFAVLVASALGKVIYIPVPTLLYRQHENNTVGAVTCTPPLGVLKRFSPEFKNIKASRYEYENTLVEQAILLANTYASRLSNERYAQVMGLAEALTAKRFSLAIQSLIRSKCWKPGVLPKMRQILHRYDFCKDSAIVDAP